MSLQEDQELMFELEPEADEDGEADETNETDASALVALT